MSSTIGNRVRLSIFGESHGEAIGCVLDGLPAGEALDMEEIRLQMAAAPPAGIKPPPPAWRAIRPSSSPAP